MIHLVSVMVHSGWCAVRATKFFSFGNFIGSMIIVIVSVAFEAPQTILRLFIGDLIFIATVRNDALSFHDFAG